ncbi:MAG TPA: protein kinase [Planctomycetaceae bacterium]|nr:protein kinase [Planctomycetaceae bacterium]
MANEPQQTVVSRQPVFLAPPSPAELSARLPNLEVTEMLGYGGMGLVYKGRQPLLDRAVAIKLSRPDFNDEQAQQNFLREARSLAKLTHPYIVNVFDCGKTGDLFYFVMELVEGNSLRHFIAEKTLSQRDVLDFLPQIGEALQYAHDLGIVHRDVKPENVIVDRRRRVRLVDFGLAKWLGALAAPSSSDSAVAGTWGYIAPEQISTPESVDHRADIFSTGVVCYEMLTGQLPRDGFQPPSKSATVDPRFDPIVVRALARDRERRYQQMREMNADVRLLTRTPESTLNLQWTIHAPIEKVFEAWTKPDVMANWFAPTDDFVASSVEVDLRVGGNYRLDMRPKDSPQVFMHRGQYCRIEAPRLLSFTWCPVSHGPNTPETQVTIELRPNGNSTDMTLIHERFRDEADRDRHNKGWNGCLGRLARKVGAADGA